MHDHRYSTLKTTKSCAGSTYELINMFTVGLVGFRFHYILDDFVVCKMKLGPNLNAL